MNSVRPVERVDVVAAECVRLTRVVQTDSPAVAFLIPNFNFEIEQWCSNVMAKMEIAASTWFRTPIGRSVGLIPTQVQERIMKIPGRKNTKVSST